MSKPSPLDHYAYGAERTGVETVMRLSAVKRWHMIDTWKTQNLAEHSANVALLGYYVAASSPHMFFGPGFYVAGHALLHDLSEVFIGDIPTHSKRWLDKEAIDNAEELILPFIFKSDPMPEQKLLIKLCDLADGIRFIRLHGVDMTSVHAKEGLEKQFGEKLYEACVKWPREVFDHTHREISFYAYEIGNGASQTPIDGNEQVVEDHMARGQGNHPRGSGPVVRDERVELRDGVAGTQGDWLQWEPAPTRSSEDDSQV